MQELALHATVGTGTFGRVRVVQHKPSSKFFALKILKKSEVRMKLLCLECTNLSGAVLRFGARVSPPTLPFSNAICTR